MVLSCCLIYCRRCVLACPAGVGPTRCTLFEGRWVGVTMDSEKPLAMGYFFPSGTIHLVDICSKHPTSVFPLKVRPLFAETADMTRRLRATLGSIFRPTMSHNTLSQKHG